MSDLEKRAIALRELIRYQMDLLADTGPFIEHALRTERRLALEEAADYIDRDSKLRTGSEVAAAIRALGKKDD